MKILSLLQSVLAAAFGVQSGRKHKEDFASGSPIAFIIAGVLFTILFVACLIFLAQYLASMY